MISEPYRRLEAYDEMLTNVARFSHAVIIVLLIIAEVSYASAAEPDGAAPGVIRGIIRNRETGEAVPLANVSLHGTVLGAATDNLGRFKIVNVPPGAYRLSVSVVGFRRETIDVALEGSGDLALNIELDPAPIEIAPVVVTASRREQDVFDVPVSFSIVTAGDIEKRNVLTADEVLRHAPGVDVIESQVGVRGSSGFNRGAGSRLLLLVDGVPALSGDTGDIRWDLIPPDQIQRIEIVKSPSSSLYGSSALGGVINIVTRPVSDVPATRFRAFAGYFDDPYYPQWRWTSEWLTFTGLDVSHSRMFGDLGLLAAFGMKTSDGYRRNGDFERASAMAKLTYSVRQSHLVTGFVAWALDEYGHSTEWKSQSDALDIDEAAWHDRTRSEKLAGYAKLRNLMSSRSIVSATLNWYYTDWDNDFHDVKDDARALRLGGTLQLDRVLDGSGEATLGVEGWHTGVASSMFGDRQIGEIGVFAEAKAALSRDVSITAGARYDKHHLGKHAGWQDLLSPRAALVIRTGRSSSVNISVGRGFRAPTVAEMFTETTVGGFTVKPNLDLSSENGITYEVGWTGDLWGRLRAGSGVFRSDYRDLIEPAIDEADGKIHFTNIHDASVTGFEVWQRTAPVLDLLAIASSYMYLSTRDEATGEPLAYRSKHTFKTSVDITRRLYSLGMDFTYKSRVERVKVYESDERVPIYLTDLRGEVMFGHLWLSAKISNIFQYNYTEVERTLAPIRRFTLTLGGRF